MRHTQGPWVFMLSANGDTLSLVNIREMPMRNGTIEETVLSINRGTMPVDANRRLIAAAPEMLESLEALLSELDQNGCHHYMNEASSYADSYNDIIRRCRLAVSKAKEQL